MWPAKLFKDWWQGKGKHLFPGTNRLGRKLACDLGYYLSKLDKRLGDVWLKRNGLRSEFRGAVGKGLERPRMVGSGVTKQAAAKTMAARAGISVSRPRLQRQPKNKSL